MNENSAIIIDASNLNVVYRYNNRFVAALNYKECIDMIANDTFALPTGSAAFISILPRQKGEGNYIIKEISYGFPFEVDAEEILTIYNLLKECKKISNIYICNQLANITTIAKVPNYTSLIDYGNKLALYEVEDRMLSKLQVFNSFDEFLEVKGANYDCYGEFDIIDNNILIARYSELSTLKSNIIATLGHLFTALNSGHKVNIIDILDDLLDVFNAKPEETGQPVIEEQTESEPQKEIKQLNKHSLSIQSIKREEKKRTPTLENSESSVEVRHISLSSLIPKLFITAISGLVIGSCAGTFMLTSDVTAMQNDIRSMQSEIPNLEQTTDIFSNSLNKAQNLNTAYKYLLDPTANIDITLVSISSTSNQYFVRLTCTGTDTPARVEEYLNKKFTVVSMDIYSSENNAGIDIYDVGITFA